PQSPELAIQELDFQSYLAKSKKGYEAAQSQTLKCSGCGALSTLAGNALGAACAFCGAPVVLEAPREDVVRPEGVLPFKVTRQEVADRFRKWVGSLWFAPTALKQQAEKENQIQGVYRPH